MLEAMTSREAPPNYKDTRPASIKSWIEAGRWAKVPEAIRQMAQICELECTVTVERRLLRETTFFEVSGEAWAVLLFKSYLEKALEEYGGMEVVD